MSRIGKQPINIPDKLEIVVKDRTINFKGPMGELSLELPDVLDAEHTDNALVIKPIKESPQTTALWGLFRSLAANMAQGALEGFNKQLDIEGVGYKAEVNGNDLVMQLGYSHPVVMPIPDDLNVQVEKSTITVSGPDKQKVGQLAADIREKRKPEPYKGKGIRYKGEHVRRKAGKRAIAGGSPSSA